MKTPRFWYRPPDVLSRLLAPAGQAYRAAGLLRRKLVAPYRAAVPVICVGNVVAGGAGKTPVALAIAAVLKRLGRKPVFVSRGYGGAESGPLPVDPGKHTAREVGDEALLLASVAPCWIGRDRTAAVRAAEREATHIILDDGLQNPAVAHSLSLLVIDGETGVGNGELIPAGPLRETLADALKRVDAVIMIGDDRSGIFSHLSSAGKTLPVLRSFLRPCLPEGFPRGGKFFAFAGIARPEKFYATCREAGLDVVRTRDFPDHHMFRAEELAELAGQARRGNLNLITTEKDAQRIPREFRSQISVLPVEISFEEEERLLFLLQSSTTAPRFPS